MNIITYGTFDFFHYGHFALLKRAANLKNKNNENEQNFFIVAVSSDEFNAQKDKKSLLNFVQRKEIIASLKFVDLVIAEHSWQQKISDIQKYQIDLLVMGDDCKFDYLKEYCQVLYFPRTPKISTSLIKELL